MVTSSRFNFLIKKQTNYEKYISSFFFLAFSVSLFSQATVSEEWQAYEINEETGEVEIEILVYVVKSGNKAVAKFFPEVGKELELSLIHISEPTRPY